MSLAGALREADRLTASLESAGSVAPLQVLNQAGRQRMLSQRFAKLVLMELLALLEPVLMGQELKELLVPVSYLS